MAQQKGIVSIPASGGEAGLNRYLSEIKKFPILAPEEEYMLAKRWREHGDTDAAAKLVNSHLRLVAKLRRRTRAPGHHPVTLRRRQRGRRQRHRRQAVKPSVPSVRRYHS